MQALSLKELAFPSSLGNPSRLVNFSVQPCSPEVWKWLAWSHPLPPLPLSSALSLTDFKVTDLPTLLFPSILASHTSANAPILSLQLPKHYARPAAPL